MSHDRTIQEEKLDRLRSTVSKVTPGTPPLWKATRLWPSDCFTGDGRLLRWDPAIDMEYPLYKCDECDVGMYRGGPFHHEDGCSRARTGYDCVATLCGFPCLDTVVHWERRDRNLAAPSIGIWKSEIREARDAWRKIRGLDATEETSPESLVEEMVNRPYPVDSLPVYPLPVPAGIDKP